MQGSATARGEKGKRCGATADGGRAERRGGGQQRHEAETAGQRGGTVNACGYVEKLERGAPGCGCLSRAGRAGMEMR